MPPDSDSPAMPVVRLAFTIEKTQELQGSFETILASVAFTREIVTTRCGRYGRGALIAKFMEIYYLPGLIKDMRRQALVLMCIPCEHFEYA